MNDSEKWVHQFCERSFLRLWSYPTPLRRDGKELCDVLVVCHPYVLLLSVKNIAYKETPEPEVGMDRWIRKAVDDSVRQLDVAAQELDLLTHVVRHDGSEGLPIPAKGTRKLFKIAVALGAGRRVPFGSGDLGKSFVHVFDEHGWATVAGELDTVEDFVRYLSAKEDLASRCKVILEGGEEDLLALYLKEKRSFPTEPTHLIVSEGMWRDVQTRPEWGARKEADAVSYTWDFLIDTLAEHLDFNPEGPPNDPNEVQVAVRTMAKENRVARRSLCEIFVPWHRQRRGRARMVTSPATGVGYVFLAAPAHWSREVRRASLANRVFVARRILAVPVVVGLATEEYDPAGFSLDAVYLHRPTWTPDDDSAADGLQEQFGYWKAVTSTSAHVDEFPKPNPG